MHDDLDSLLAGADEQEQTSQKSSEIALLKQQIAKDESETRRKLAKDFIRWYFIILAGILLLVPLYNFVIHQRTSDHMLLLLDVTDVLQVYSSIVGPLAGFVIAYYFKNK